MVHFLEIFIMLLFISGIFIVHFHNLSRHYIIINPDNSTTTDGFILKYWSYFWEAVVGTKLVFYDGEALLQKYELLRTTLPKIAEKLDVSSHREYLYLTESGLKDGLSDDDKTKTSAILQVLISESEGFYYFYIEENIYRFPEWVRNPVSQCTTCMASVFGSFIWLSVNYCHTLFYWTNHKYFAFLLFWFIFVVVLSGVNTYLNRKF